MTYREAIQIQIAAVQKIYDNCGALRDAATGEEKRYWNDMRGGLGALWPVLQRLDNSLRDERASMQLEGNYPVVVKE